MGSQSGREERRDESFENFRHSFSLDLTDCPKVSQDAVEFGVSAIEMQKTVQQILYICWYWFCKSLIKQTRTFLDA